MEVDIRQIYKEVVKPGLRYCRVCFRSAKETKLVKPRHLLALVNYMYLNIFTNIVDVDETVCYMCEGTAASALQLYHACVNSTRIQDIFKTVKKATAFGLRKETKECSENLKKYRQQTTLKYTEILNVDSLGVEFSRNNTSHQTLSKTESVSCTSEKDIEMVVLSDDDDEPPTVSTSENEITVSKPAPKRYKRTPFKKGNIPLDNQHSKKKTTTQQTVTPTKKATTQNEIVKTGDVPKMPKLVPIDKLLDYPLSERANVASLMPNKMQLINGQQENFILHPVVVGGNGNLVVPSFGAEIRNGELVFDPKLLKPMPVVDATGGMILIQNGQIMPYKQQDTITNEPDRSVVTHNGKVIGTKNKPKNTQSASNNVQIQENNAIDKPIKNVIDYNAVEYSDLNRLEEQNVEVDTLLRKALVNRNISPQAKHGNTVQQAHEEYIVDLDIVNNLLNNSENNSDEMAVISEVASSYIKSNSDINSLKHMVDSIESSFSLISDRGSGILISNVTSSYDMDSGAPIAIISDVSSQAVAQEKSGKIDWEDKIPMDVISYMDATDPHAETETIVPDRSDRAPANFTMYQAKEDDSHIINLC